MADPQPFADFLALGPSRDDFLSRGIGKFRSGVQPVGQGARDLESTITNNLGAFGGSGLPMGLANLNEILFNQGKTDPAAFNRDLLANARNTEQQQQQVRGSAASRGMQNSGANNAIEAAVGAAGADREAAIRANETQTAENRKRNDLLLMLQTIINPGLSAAGLTANRDVSFSGQNMQAAGNTQNALGTALGIMLGGG